MYKRNLKLWIGAGICVLALFLLGRRLLLSREAQKEYDSLANRTEVFWDKEELLKAETESKPEGTPEEPSFAINPKLEGLSEENPDTAGWIEIPGTNIDYPVVQGESNDYYIDHTFHGEENPAGAIFMEAANTKDFSDLVTFIYGHRMRDGSMFGNLKYYTEKRYWEEHPKIFISTQERELEYEIFSAHRAEVGTSTYTLFFEANEAYESYLQREKELSWYDTGVEVDRNDQVLILVTCTADQENERIVVLGKLKEQEKESP